MIADGRMPKARRTLSGTMKVAIITEWLDPWRGGAETSTQQFMHHLMDRGVELHVFTRSRPSPTPGLSVYSLNGAAMSRTRRSVTFAHRVERRIREGSFDLVHAISPCQGADVYQPRGGTVAESIERNIALCAPGTAQRFKRHANWFNFKQRYMLGVERKLLGQRNGPTVVAISNYVVRQLKQHYDLSDDRICKIYNGVDADPTPPSQREVDRKTIRNEFGISADDLLVLVVAHNFRLKGVHRWMEAVALLRRRGISDVRTLVVGRGDSHRWHRLADRLGVSKVLTFVGPSERVRVFHHASDVLVHATYYDPCSRVVLEAMVAGVPCVTTRWDGASEMIVDGKSGFVLADPGDVDALAQRVTSLRDARKQREMGIAAAKIAEQVSMARHADEMIELYKRLLPTVESRR